ncbi:NADPH:quinone oxidoreductase family protein [Pontixanthobacter aestiaquae]|uniref:Zinc-binding dehydrogenase n=1 Tax=Pontixanthobacter aestiaquae TaxID=1509367 RepID=A0A844Z9Z0_9SPHN|nr:NADPH:quinone oxidoreductase family protein [Pontixanthobacter aestiaquae]MDN3645153.1 NADPH:quinone oxidoreductase family protein [Pontixanthobacter aestiaquae]MXO83847.1 zinc-binding dehydrogenase [Pontixanthobacter aestiaquae]
MRALQVTSLSSDLSGCELVDLPVPKRRPGEALVRIHATSLNFPDLLMTRGEYQFKPEPPFISGMELSGEVIAVDTDSSLAVGDRVMGGSKTGAMAGYAAVPERNLRLVPEGLDYPKAAALGAAYTTAYTALVEQGALEAGQWVLVHGASGGVSLAAIDLAKSLGAKVIAATGSPEKMERIGALYAPDAVIESVGRFREQVAEITDGKLCDLVLDTVGGDIFDESTRCVAFAGKLLVVGFVGGRIADIATNIPLIKGFSVVGVRAGEYARRFPDRGKSIADEVSRMASAGQITPAIDRALPLSEWRQAFEAMANRELVGKVILIP